ncbi:hypothetical protein [Rouxiella sp. WC2420]|uniref:Uncharacterized protein n=1 Tax=Rouxiella sp. WC2420 TaxID=3234145 RepID=A0AB39VUS7_9GAMM
MNIKTTPSTLPPETSESIRDKFKALCVPTQDDFDSLINVCALANTRLGLNDSVVRSPSLTIDKNQRISLQISPNGGLKLIDRTDKSGSDLQIDFGIGFKAGESLALNTGQGITDDKGKLALNLAPNSGIAKDFHGLLAVAPITFAKKNDAAPDKNKDEMLAVTIGSGLFFNGNHIEIKLTPTLSGLVFAGSELNIKHSEVLCVKDGFLTVNIDNI